MHRARRHTRWSLALFLLVLAGCAPRPAAVDRAEPALPTEDGYRGIWYSNQPDSSVYRYKYSGGLATYPQQHIPIAIYRPEVDKTFFTYGAVDAETGQLVYAVSYFDHATGTVPRPTRLGTKDTDDAHDNPVLSIDDDGHLYVFMNAHGTARPSAVWRSTRPYDITAFAPVLEDVNFSYAQPWHLPGLGFLWLHTRYRDGRNLYWTRSRDGVAWDEAQLLVRIEQGNYQISWPLPDGRGVGTAFDMHPEPVGALRERPDYVGLNWRSNIYYLQTTDFGATWTTVDGSPVDLPVTTADHPALAYDSRADGLLVYLKDLAYDADGHPVILFLTAPGYEVGPENDPRSWHTLRWDGTAWQRSPTITTSDNNYDHGSLYIEPDGTWRIIAPTAPGPQAYNPGGEMVLWTSRDQGATWTRVKQLTQDSPYNHTYARRPLHAHPAFYAIWADGHGRQPSPSRLYVTERAGTQVWRLPEQMPEAHAQPEPVRYPDTTSSH